MDGLGLTGNEIRRLARELGMRHKNLHGLGLPDIATMMADAAGRQSPKPADFLKPFSAERAVRLIQMHRAVTSQPG